MSNKTNLIFTSILYSCMLILIIIWAPWGKNFENFKLYYFYYLFLALIIWVFGFRFFGGKFIRPKWKIPGKFIGYIILSTILLILFDHYALVFIIGHQSIGGVTHYLICKKNGIDFWTCEPKSKYIELTEKWAKGNFGKSPEKN